MGLCSPENRKLFDGMVLRSPENRSSLMAWVYMTENRKFFDGLGLCSTENRSSLMAWVYISQKIVVL